jgi:hypothetical protein
MPVRIERVGQWSSLRRQCVAGLVVILAMALLAACASNGGNAQSWPEGTDHGPWRSVFTGYGSAGTTAAGTLILSPKPATGTDTHAALIASVASYGDFDAQVRLRTNAQLRQPQPNPWEVAWVLWHYTDPTHFCYVALKSNGWEIGKEDPTFPGSQRFLATGPASYTVGQWHELRVTASGNTYTVWADGIHLATVTDSVNPYPHGRIGLYAEDSIGEFTFPSIRP